ncbi:MAG: hypothetical protein ACKVKV_03535, partial [Dehalococcoidia bacterium]
MLDVRHELSRERVNELNMNWHEIDRFLMGEAWSGSQIKQHLTELADVIGPRWGGSAEDLRAAAYIRNQMEAAGVDRAEVEPFTLETWNHGDVSISLPDDNNRPIAALPFLRCKATNLTTPLVNAGHASPHEVEALGGRIEG